MIEKLFNMLRKVKWNVVYEYQLYRYSIILKRKQKKKCFNIVFFATFASTWKYDYLYNILVKDRRFNVTIIVCPVINYGYDYMIEEMDRCYILFKTKGYNVIKSYNKEEEKYLDVKKICRPDIVFYTNPYKGLIDDRYYITNFLDCLTCYAPYCFRESAILDELEYNQLLHNLLWIHFYETNSHVKLSYEKSDIKGKNVILTGYSGIDRLIDKSYIPIDPWKKKERNIKRIIWAPHHTVGENQPMNYSNFPLYAEFMQCMAMKYEKNIQIAFKPHPLLKEKLYKLPNWGKEKTDLYYQSWNKMSNGMLCESDYIDLFLTSDAMIHDSGSFLIEYIYVNKPVQRIISNFEARNDFNSIGKKCFDIHYLAQQKADVEAFILNVINGVDPLKEKRTLLLKEELMPPSGILASENIYNYLCKQLKIESRR